MWTLMCAGIDMCTCAKKSFMHKHKSWVLVTANFTSADLGAHRHHHTHFPLCTQTHICAHNKANSESKDLKSCIWAFPSLLDKPVPRGQVSQWKQLWHQEPVPWERRCLFLHHHPGTPPPSPPQPPRSQARHQSKREKPEMNQLGCFWNPICFLSQFLHIGSNLYSSLMSSCKPKSIPK